MANKKNPKEDNPENPGNALEETKSLLGLASADARLALERSKAANDKAEQIAAELKTSVAKLEKSSNEFKALEGEFDETSKTLDKKYKKIEEKLVLFAQEHERMKKLLQEDKHSIESFKQETDEQLEGIKQELEHELKKGADILNKVKGSLAGVEGLLLRSEEAGKKLAQWDKKITDITSHYENIAKNVKESSKIAEENYNKVNLAIKLVNQLEERTKGFVAAPYEEVPDEEQVKSALDFSLNDLLQVMIKHHASDLHLKVGTPPSVRLDGELIPIGEKALQEEDCAALILPMLKPHLRRRLEEFKEVDFAYHLPEARFRVNAFYQRSTLSASFRMLRYEIPGIEELGLPEVLKNLATHEHGLIIITGPAGSGKSTTLASMIDYINSTRKVHIITIEDPIEFVHSDKLSMVTQREVGTDTLTFASGLKQALRQDPNVILIGEMRDPETIMTAAMAAETGHLVLTTLHASNTFQAIDRITDVFSGENLKQIRLLLSNNLRGAISQRLLSRADGEGRVPATEVMVVTPTISALILEAKTNEIYPYVVQGGTEGMQTFTAALIKLYEAGKITKEEALRNADSPNEFRMALEGHTTSSNLVEDTLSSWL